MVLLVLLILLCLQVQLALPVLLCTVLIVMIIPFYFRKMQNPPCTIICFDYRRHYMKDVTETKWISRDGEVEDEFTRLC